MVRPRHLCYIELDDLHIFSSALHAAGIFTRLDQMVIRNFLCIERGCDDGM